MSCNSTGDGKGLELYKGHSPLSSGVRQAPHFTYSHSAASTKHTRCLSSTTHTCIATTCAKCSKRSQHQEPVKPTISYCCTQIGAGESLSPTTSSGVPRHTPQSYILLDLLLHMQHLPHKSSSKSLLPPT